jgi:AcrR family transcriptional regulator
VPKISEEAKQARREQILTGARRCFARYGYEGATVARLEEEIGLSRGAIFNWFPSKEELFIELATRDNIRLLQLIVDRGLEEIVSALAEEDADWLAVYFEFGRRLRASEELRARWKELVPAELRGRADAWIVEGQRSGELRADMKPEEIGVFLGALFDGIVVRRALGFENPDPEPMLKLMRTAISGPGQQSR